MQFLPENTTANGGFFIEQVKRVEVRPAWLSVELMLDGHYGGSFFLILSDADRLNLIQLLTGTEPIRYID